jgi:deoxyadenosine/deoxycytidine kinase
MAEHTQIIDLYGIPACGKTTLARYMASHPADGLRVATMEDCSIAALNDKWHLFLSVSLKNVWASIRLRLSAPFDKKRSVIPFKSILLLNAYKNYIRKYTDYNIVVTDHGDIQSFVSLERGDNLHENQKFKEACCNYLDASLSSAYVYCQIDAETALRRINGRNRDKGRIDSLSDQNLQLQELERERERFDFWTTVLKERKAVLFELDMKEASSMIADKLFLLLQK